MIPLKPEFIENCPVEDGFRLRGLDMTRIEVFVDAAFAFAVTMLVISFDAIPTTYEEMILAIKSIPAFVVAVVQIVWIWQTHNTWSRRYGLETAWTVALSTALLIVVLIYIYPLRIMAGGMFSWFTSGYLPTNFNLESMDQLRGMFVFLGIGFTALSLVFAMMYRYAASLREPLLLSDRELYRTRTVQYLWAGASFTGVLCLVLALALPVDWVPFSGFAFMLLAGWFPLGAGGGGRKPTAWPETVRELSRAHFLCGGQAGSMRPCRSISENPDRYKGATTYETILALFHSFFSLPGPGYTGFGY